jgi:N,N'-diacetyllegionaminate synthase
LPVGWSDHTEGSAITVAAAALGADLIEKHFTLDRGLPGPDHAASLEPAELGAMIASIRAVEQARGDGVKRPAASELANLRVVRRSLHAARDIAAGSLLTADDLISLRPGGGVEPAHEHFVVGKKALRTIPRGKMLSYTDVG